MLIIDMLETIWYIWFIMVLCHVPKAAIAFAIYMLCRDNHSP
jgi:hypothetical protein